MSDVKEAFATLQDDATAAGLALISRVEGDVAAAKRGSIGFAFKDAAGNVVLPSLDALGNIKIALMYPPPLSAKGELAAGSLTAIDVTGASITLALAKVYTNLAFAVCCRSDSLFQVVHVNDSAGTPVETVVCEAIVGPGNYTQSIVLPGFKLDTTADTGVPLLKIKAKNFEMLNSLRGSLSVNQAL